MKLLISFGTYPRDGKSTYGLLEKTFKSLIENQDLSELTIKILVVGDDYPAIGELAPIFTGFDTQFYNINQNDALRNKDIPKEVKWKQAVQRTKIFILQKTLISDFDYILMSSDDDLYCNQKITKSIEYIKQQKYPDFVFCFGKYLDNMTLPNTYTNYPQPEKVISSGCIYKASNKSFIQTILQFRKKCWCETAHYLKQKELYKRNPNSLLYNITKFESTLKPEDYQLWSFLKIYFCNRIFTCFLIPEIQVLHESEQSIYQYIENKTD